MMNLWVSQNADFAALVLTRTGRG